MIQNDTELGPEIEPRIFTTQTIELLSTKVDTVLVTIL